LRGKPIEILVPQGVRSKHVANRHAYNAEPRIRPMGIGLDLYGLRKDGSEFPVEISLSPVTIDGETVVVGAIRDTSDRKVLEQALLRKNLELQAANTAKDMFLASMSHELRTPWNSVIGFTGSLLMKLPGPLNEEQRRFLEIVMRSSQRLMRQVGDLLVPALTSRRRDHPKPRVTLIRHRHGARRRLALRRADRRRRPEPPAGSCAA